MVSDLGLEWVDDLKKKQKQKHNTNGGTNPEITDQS